MDFKRAEVPNAPERRLRPTQCLLYTLLHVALSFPNICYKLQNTLPRIQYRMINFYVFLACLKTSAECRTLKSIWYQFQSYSWIRLEKAADESDVHRTSTFLSPALPGDSHVDCNLLFFTAGIKEQVFRQHLCLGTAPWGTWPYTYLNGCPFFARSEVT